MGFSVEKSPAEKAGLKAGDIVIKIGSRDIDDTGDVSKAIRKHEPDEEVAMRQGIRGKMKALTNTRNGAK